MHLIIFQLIEPTRLTWKKKIPTIPPLEQWAFVGGPKISLSRFCNHSLKDLVDILQLLAKCIMHIAWTIGRIKVWHRGSAVQGKLLPLDRGQGLPQDQEWYGSRIGIDPCFLCAQAMGSVLLHSKVHCEKVPWTQWRYRQGYNHKNQHANLEHGSKNQDLSCCCH